MPGVPANLLLDLLSTTLEKLPSGEFEVALKYQTYPICDQWFRRERRKVMAGKSISLRIQLQTNGSARHVLLYEPTPNNQVDLMSSITADWVYLEGKMHYEAHEVDMNRSPAKLVDLVKERRIAAYMDMADEIEERAWDVPIDSSDGRHPLGVPYWINFLDTGTEDYDGSFSGKTAIYQDGSTTTTVGGIDGSLAENEKWRNWAANRSTVFDMALIDTLRRGLRRVKFRPPVTVRDMYSGPASTLRIYSGQDDADEYERLVNAGPDDRNGDLNPFGGVLTFKRIPWIAIPPLDTATYQPIYVLNHRQFFPYVLRNWWMREDEPIRDRSQRHVYTVGIDCAYQFFCTNRRAGGFVIHTPT